MFSSLHAISTVTLALHWTIVVALSVRVIFRRLPVGVSLSWLAVVFSVPFAGAIAYLVFGEKRLGPTARARLRSAVRAARPTIESLQRSPEASAPADAALGEALCRHAQRVLGSPALTGNHIRLFAEMEEIFDSLVADIDNARESCRLAFYIWHEGGRADDVIAALIRARERGVTCRILADALGSAPFLKGPVVPRLRAAGIEVVVALPPSIWRRADLRNHRKIVVIDDRIGYTGSQNLVDPRFFKQDVGVGPWVDAIIRIEGPATVMLAHVFEVDRSVETARSFEAPRPWRDEGRRSDEGTLVQVVPSGPAFRPDAIHQLILTAIYSAKRELVITTPYFVPDEALLTALLSAGLRGVDVTLIVPAKNDSFLVRHASVAHYDDLLAAGARIALFEGGLLHTKSMVIDGELSLFGSVNLDMRSMWLNFEISAVVYGGEFARRLRTLQERYLEQSTLVDADAWKARPARVRFLQDAIRLLGPLL
jgi:cardiolipin synthase